MNLYKRIFSTLLAVILMVGSLSAFSVIEVSAAAEETEEEVTIDQIYLNTVYNTPEEKVFGKEGEDPSMKLMLERGNQQLYVDPVSGEVAVVDTVTGSILLSNPYDVSKCGGYQTVALEALDQLVVQYLDNGNTKYLRSFRDAAMVDQISIFNIKNGVRAEYIIGSEATRRLVPRLCSQTSFDKYIKAPMTAALEKEEFENHFYKKFLVYFNEQGLGKGLSKKAEEQLILKYPIVEKFDIVICTAKSAADLAWLESVIKNYCEDYTFEQMDADHEECGYVAEDEQSPVFKMALEYTLDENGLNVRLPCNGLRYDMTTYTLENLSVLPYMGAGNGMHDGYNFFPDGSGSLFDFAENKTTTTVRGKVYGVDYAYHQIAGKLQKAIRYPVYGTVATEKFYTFDYNFTNDKKETETKRVTISSTILGEKDVETYITETLKGTLNGKVEETTEQRGFVAIIESGESMADIATYHAGSLSSYHTMMNYFNPKPKDSYDIADAISATSSSTWTVVSDRKYTGSIKIRYIMLNDPVVGEATQTALKEEGKNYAYYETNWLGMAEAYRDYLVEKGTLTPLAGSDKLTEDIPLYMEVFGALETEGEFLTVPVDVMTPLTTFDDIYTMYGRLSKLGNIKNINFKLTGFANGGMYATMPSSLKWEKVVGGADGLKQLIKDAEKINAEENANLGLYPDFDFAYSHVNKMFDSLYLKDDAVKTIDNRYSSKRQYSATQQTYVSFFELAISPSRYSKFYEKLLANYEEYGLKTLSIASLGSALNTDFDEDDPYNREDSKQHTIQAFEDMKKAGYSLMTEGGNAYTWGYIDHLLNVDLDSSRYIKSSASVPFIGAVLHGYLQFAGTPVNEEGDTDYAILRAIENGSALYFILSYQNTSELKEDMTLSQYYSIRYDIWENDVINYYNELNTLMKDVQDKVIIDHKFLNDVSERVLDLDEFQEAIEQALEKAAEEEAKNHQNAENEMYLEVADAWRFAENVSSTLQGVIEEMILINDEDIIAKHASLTKESEDFAKMVGSFLNEINANYKLLPEEDKADFNVALEKLLSTENRLGATMQYASSLNTKMRNMKNYAVHILQSKDALQAKYDEFHKLYNDLAEAVEIVKNSKAIAPEIAAAISAEMKIYLDAATVLFEDAEKELNRSESSNAITKDSTIQIACDALKALTTEGTTYTMWEDTLKSITEANMYDADLIKEEAKATDEIEGGDEGDDDSVINSLVNNNQIVLVTYGDRADRANGFEKTPVKSFILNYNTFAVRVTYNGVTYTVPSGGYVIITH